jgi:Domain of unknown function (DUF3543)
MISGEPPFHGENHIDLLRNIQRKAVRLPKEVRVSKECVNLLRILLNRNPLTRAGFKEFFEGCDAFVVLGCQGIATVDEGTCKRPSMDLGTIPENPETAAMSESLMTVATNAPSPQQQQQQQALVKAPASAPIPIDVSSTLAALPKPRSHFFSPLVPSPPTSSGTPIPAPAMTELPTISTKRMPQPIEMPIRRNDEIASGLHHNDADENSFVMVEHGSSLHKSPPEPCATTTTAVVSHYSEPYGRHRLEQSPPSSSGFLLNRIPVLPGRGDYMVVKQPKGMLSTSPGTGGALMGMLLGRPQLTAARTNDSDSKQVESQIKATTKMLAAAEDVGRRAISVAHLGDKRAYFAMRMLMMNDSSSSSILSATPMEGIEEESGDHDSGAVTDDSSSTEIMASVRRRRSSTSIADKSMADVKAEDEADEMPFAVHSESAPLLAAGLPSRSSASFHKDASMISPRPLARPTPVVIRSHFSEALTCYLKALKMLKGAVGATEGVSKELDALAGSGLTTDQQIYISQLKLRSEVTLNWLGNQFKGVLERGDAANTEIGKLPLQRHLSEQQPVGTSVEELLYNHALGYGREGAVKQLLGHYEAARACYRSAGLLAETLLMEPRIEGDDRKTLEVYVDGFAAQITELDELLLQQSQCRLAGSSATSSYTSSRRGPPVVGLVGNPFSILPANK